jgi:hypothetical protein
MCNPVWNKHMWAKFHNIITALFTSVLIGRAINKSRTFLTPSWIPFISRKKSWIIWSRPIDLDQFPTVNTASVHSIGGPTGTVRIDVVFASLPAYFVQHCLRPYSEWGKNYHNQIVANKWSRISNRKFSVFMNKFQLENSTNQKEDTGECTVHTGLCRVDGQITNNPLNFI